MKLNYSIILKGFILSILISASFFTRAANYTWTGTTDTDWVTGTNWSPNGTVTSSDTVTIVTHTNLPVLAANTTVKKFTMTSGTLDCNGFTLTISANATFTAGAINNGTVTCSGTGTLTFTATTFGAAVNATGNSILLNGCKFNSTFTAVKKGTSNDSGNGGNYFAGAASITDSSSGFIVLSNTSAPDTFNSTLTVASRGSGSIYLAHQGTNNVFNGKVTMYSSSSGKIYSNYYGTSFYNDSIVVNSTSSGGITFGASTGSCTLASGKTILIGSEGFDHTAGSGNYGTLYLRNFLQNGSTAINLTLTGSRATIKFEDGSSFGGAVTISAPGIFLDGSRFLGKANMTYSTASGFTITSGGGNYFGDSTTIIQNAGSTVNLATTSVDTFATYVVLQNNATNLSINNALFQGNVKFKNALGSQSEHYWVGSSGNVTIKGNATVENANSAITFGGTGGTVVLDTNCRITIPSGSGIVKLMNVVQHGSDTISIPMSASTDVLYLLTGNVFNGPFIFNGNRIFLNGTTFNGTVNIKRTSGVTDACDGGNVFNSTTVICDSVTTSNSNRSFQLATINADDFNGNVTFKQYGVGAGASTVRFYPAYTKNSTFAGNITVDGGAAIEFGANGGKIILDGSSTQTLSKSASYVPSFKRIQINKSGGVVSLSYPLTLSDTLFLTKGIIATDTTNIITVPDNGVVSGGSDSSYVNGPLKKIGNDAFTFALGDTALHSSAYHSFGITEPSSTSDAFTARYYATGSGIADGDTLDSLEISSCEYWTLKHPIGSSTVRATLGWNNSVCKTGIDSLKVVAGYKTTSWKNLGRYAQTSSSGKGTITSDSLLSLSGSDIYKLTLGSNVPPLALSTSTIPEEYMVYRNGKAIANTTGGSLPISYLWDTDPLQTNDTASGLRAGQYRIIIIDDLGYTKSALVNIDLAYNYAASVFPTTGTYPPPCVDWKRIDYPGSPSYGSPLNQNSNLGEDWWFGHNNSKDLNDVADGYVCVGYSRPLNWEYTEPNEGYIKVEMATSPEDCEDGYYLGGYPNYGLSTLQYLGKFDVNGNRIWLKQLNLGCSHGLYHIFQTADHSYIAIGSTQATRDPETGLELLYNYNGTASNYFVCNAGNTCTPSDGALCSDLQSKKNFISVIKLNFDGTVAWNRIYGYANYGGTDIANHNSNCDWFYDGTDGFEYEDGNGIRHLKIVGWGYDVASGSATGIRGLILDIMSADGYLNSKELYEDRQAPNDRDLRFTAAEYNPTNRVYAVVGYEGNNGNLESVAFRFDLAIGPIETDSWIISNQPNSTTYDVIFDANNIDILVPVIESCNTCNTNGGGDNYGDGTIYSMTTGSTTVTAIASLNPTADFNDKIHAYDLKIGICNTSDGGFACVSTKIIQAFDSDYPGGRNWNCGGSQIYTSDPGWEYLNSNAYVAKFDNVRVPYAGLDWETDFTIDDKTPTFFPGDLKKQECLYTITQADDGSYVIAGNNSRNLDDGYLVKLYDDCEQTEVTYTIDESTTNVTTLLGNPISSISSSKTIRGSIHVEDGEILTITGSSTVLEFADSRKVCTETNIVVEPGGTLIVEQGSTLTSIAGCPGSMWDGIQVWGDEQFSQSIGAGGMQGLMYINTGALIENARMGTLVGKGKAPTYHETVLNNPGGSIIRHGYVDIDPGHGGGVLRSNGALYTNNRRSIHFEPYPYSVLNNKSDILSTDFLCNAYMLDPDIALGMRRAGINTFVSMWDVHHVGFSLNTFTDVSPTDWDLRGTGLATIDADFDGDQNSFSGNKFGLTVGNVSSTSASFQLHGSTISNNYKGILVRYVDNFQIYDNDVNVGYDILPSQYGLCMEECNGYQVSQNDFTNTNGYPGWGLTDKFSTSNSNYNIIYKNTFSDLNIGNIYMDELRGLSGNGDGLKVRCNEYNNSISRDIAVTSQPGISLSEYLNGALPVEADNSFTGSCAGGAISLSNCSSCGPINKYWCHTNFDAANVLCYSGPVTIDYTQNLFDPINSCLDIFPLPAPPNQHILMNQAKLIIDSIETLIDGGNTDVLMAIIKSGSRQERYDALLAATPYLTARVLDTLLTITGIFSADTLGIFYVRNAALPDSIFNKIDTASTLPIDSASLDSLITLQMLDSSAMKLSLGNLEYWHSIYESNLNEALAIYMQDTLPAAIDSMIILLSGDTNELRARQLYEIYVRKSDFSNGDSMLTVIATEYPQLDNYVILQNIILELKEDSVPVASLRDSTDLLAVIDTLAQDTTKYGFAGARILQKALLDIDYPEIIIEPDTCHVPAVPGSISGPEYGECAQTGVSYSIAPITGASAYKWTVSNVGAVIVGPANLSGVSIDFRAKFVSVNLSVVAINSCGMSASSSLTVIAKPGVPPTPTGSNSVCPDDIETYSTSGSSGATYYNWTVPSGATILGPSNGASILVYWGSSSGDITVGASNNCGTSEPSAAINVSVNSCRTTEFRKSTGTVRAYPNPTKGVVTIWFKSELENDYTLTLKDPSGRILSQKTGESVKGENQVDMDMSGFAKGIYFISIKGLNKEEIVRVIVE
ncbi:MAG: T9SS type A sorting domain-containing protein [Bacteroidota bacterium]